jgi:translocation and assembly module TamB
MGQARAAVVATNEQVQLNDFVADLFNGSARGSATIATSDRAASSVRATFENVDAGGLLALTSGNAVPLTGAATGTVDLRFPGTNFKLASGRVDATFEGATGRDESARTPLTGQLALTADNGTFNIERANLRAGATELTASGRFSFRGGSDLAVNLSSSDAAELQSVALSTGLLSEFEEKIKSVGLAGNLSFKGGVTGDLDAPIVNGRFELQSLTVRGRDLGAVSADIASNATETRIDNGRLAEADGGGVAFKALIPRAGENNIEFDATLENVNAGNLVAALAADEKGGSGALAANLSGMGPASGTVSVKGYPGAMRGDADLRVAAGRIGSTGYDQIVARATFNGSSVMLDSFDVKLGDGSITAAGGIEIASGAQGLPGATVKDFRVEGKNVDLNLVTALFGGGGLPALSGRADFTATLSGNVADPTSIRANIDAQGRDVTINGRPAGQLTLVGKMTDEQKFVATLTTGLFGTPQVVRATLDLAGENFPVEAETTLTGADLTPLFAALLNNPNVQVTGRATGTIRAAGTLLSEDENASITDAISGRAEFTELSVKVQEVQLDADNPLVVTFTPREVKFEKTRFTDRATRSPIEIVGKAAVGPGGTNDLDVNGDLNLRFLSSASRNLFLSGTAHIEVGVDGTFEQPQVTGTASVQNASLALLLQNERLMATQINGAVRFNSNQANLESLTGRLGGGRVSATGGALLSGFMPTQFRLVARGENVTVPAAAFVTLPAFLGDLPTTADADLEIRGGSEGVFASGTVKVRRTEITEDIDLADLIDRRNEVPITSGAGGGPGAGAGLFGPTTIALTIQGQDALVVRNNLADMVGSLNLRVQGPIDAPVSSGRITATRGTVAFRNDRYEILRAIIDLPPRVEAPPVINLQAQSDIRGYRVTVTMSGPISGGLQTTATSDPPLPQADVIALITTGNLSGGPEGTSTLAQTGLGTATSLLTDTLINAPVQKATDKLFGLNRFEFDPVIAGRGGQSPTARITVGRQVNRNLAITYSTNVTGETNQVIAVEYRVSDRLSFIAQYQQGSTDTLRTRSNNFNFELRFRKRY